MRLIQAYFQDSSEKAVIAVVAEAEPIDWSVDTMSGRFGKSIEILIDDTISQNLLDKLQNVLTGSDDWRVVVLPVEATLPRIEETVTGPAEKSLKTANREELFQTIQKESTCNTDFIVLTVLSTIVAAIGLNSDSVAIVIAAMVIAPLLSPILAFTLGAALGDFSLMVRSAKTALIGFAIGFVTAFGLAHFMEVNIASGEMLDRTVLGWPVVALALASGAAAALTVTSRLSSALVGVMVAIALLPPSVAAAMFLASGNLQESLNAIVMLGLNITCTILSAQIIFLWKGVRPQSWLERQTAERSSRINLLVWAVLLFALFGYMISLST